MAVHLECLLRDLLRDGPLPWSEMRRSLPDYAKTQAEEVLHTLVQQGALFRHPPVNRRMGTRFALSPANPLPAARAELRTLLDRLQSWGYDRAQVRESLLEALREEEWAEAHQHPTLPAPVPEQALLDTVVEFRMPVGSP